VPRAQAATSGQFSRFNLKVQILAERILL